MGQGFEIVSTLVDIPGFRQTGQGQMFTLVSTLVDIRYLSVLKKTAATKLFYT